MVKKSRYLFNCYLRNQFQELGIKVPKNTRYISIEKCLLPRAKYMFFYSKEGFIKNKRIADKKFKKIEEILKNEG
jgi:hypothetical protein